MNLPIYAVPDRLRDYATSKKDIKEGVEVNPDEQFRLKKEDIYEEGIKAQQPAAAKANSNYSASSSEAMDECM